MSPVTTIHQVNQKHQCVSVTKSVPLHPIHYSPNPLFGPPIYPPERFLVWLTSRNPSAYGVQYPQQLDFFTTKSIHCEALTTAPTKGHEESASPQVLTIVAVRILSKVLEGPKASQSQKTIQRAVAKFKFRQLVSQRSLATPVERVRLPKSAPPRLFFTATCASKLPTYAHLFLFVQNCLHDQLIANPSFATKPAAA